MPQPIPKKIKESNPDITAQQFTTLLIDGSNLLEVSFRGYKKLSSKGQEIGGIFQFLLQLKMMLQKGNFRYVYVFWDGDQSGYERWKKYPAYKANRDKSFDDAELSDYMKEVNARVRGMYAHFKKNKSEQELKEKEQFHWQREIVMQCLEELYVRQCVADYVEADDFIGYYVTHKKPNERIVIVSNDRDLTQLIADDVIVYVQSLHKFINTKNHVQEMGYCHENVLLKKILCGDASDNIKGIKGFGEKTLFTNFSDFKTRKMTLEEIIDKSSQINEERLKSKKKPLKWAENIVNRVTDGVQGSKIYEINREIIDLRNPLLTEDAKVLMETMMYAPMDCEGRSFANLYTIIQDNDIDDLKDENIFSNFFVEYKYLIDKEQKNIQY